MKQDKKQQTGCHLQVQAAFLRLGEQQIFSGLNLEIHPQEILAVLGPSGCGKSTLLQVIAGIESLDSGHVLANGDVLDDVPTHKRGFTLMFQDGQLFMHLSVLDNVAYGLRRRGLSRRDARRQAGEYLRLVHLADFAHRKPDTLSGGQAQRVALARALAPQPRLVLLDEPLSALDQELREELAGELRRVCQQVGTSALLVTHDRQEARRIADSVVHLREGKAVPTAS